MTQVEQDALAFLSGYRPETHTIEIHDSKVRRWLLRRGFISWYPPIFGSNNQYEITATGVAYRDQHTTL